MTPEVAEPFLDVDAIHAEGPGWDEHAQVLLWVDMHGQRLHRSRSDGTDASTPYPERVAAVAPRRRGGTIIALERSVVVESASEPPRVVFRLPADDGTHFNDGKCDANGRFWIGTMASDAESPIGSLYRVDVDGKVTAMRTGVAISNGLGWSPDGRTMYHIDSVTQAVDAFACDPESGAIKGRRTLVRIDASVGMPDGLCVDSDGAIWVAILGAHAIHRYLPDGRLDMILRVPTRQVTSCAFGGAGMKDLFITTSTLGPTPPDDGAGRLYRWRSRVSGPPAHPFGG